MTQIAIEFMNLTVMRFIRKKKRSFDKLLLVNIKFVHAVVLARFYYLFKEYEF